MRFNMKYAAVLAFALASVLLSGVAAQDGATGSSGGEEAAPLAASTVKDTPPAADAFKKELAPGEKLRFVFIPKALHIPVFNYAKKGANRKAEEYGDVEIIWDAPAENDQAKQKELIEKYAGEGVHGIAVSCLNGEYLAPAIDAAIDKGIPVITWDSDAPTSRRLAYYGVNDFEAGVVMGKEIARLLGEEGGEVAVLTTLGADNLAKRLEGAMSVIRQHPKIKVVETFDVEDQAIKAEKVIQSATKTYPELRAWLSVGGWPGYSKSIISSVDPKKTFVVTFDAIPPAPELIKRGKIQLAVGQKYFGWGSQSVKILHEIVADGKLPERVFVDSGVDLVTRDNVDEYVKKWKKMERGEIVE